MSLERGLDIFECRGIPTVTNFGKTYKVFKIVIHMIREIRLKFFFFLKACGVNGMSNAGYSFVPLHISDNDALKASWVQVINITMDAKDVL